jgi:predicted nucleotidyltransferase/uncharacterized protein with HEPN domain
MREPIEHLRRIQNAISKIAIYAQKGRAAFDAEEDIRLSIIYYLQTISEAAHAIVGEFQKRHPEIPWKQFINYQSYITHYYREIDRDELWRIAHHDLPMIQTSIDSVIADAIREGVEHERKLSSNSRKTTKSLEQMLRDNRDEILSLAKRYGIENVRIFGSVARGEADSKSDIDLLVDVVPGRTLFDLGEFLADLQSLLGHDVDVVTEKSLNTRIREYVVKEAIPL